jgi:hypothetical protein
MTVAPKPGTSRWQTHQAECRVYREMVHVEEGVYRPLGELTNIDLHAAAAQRFRTAAAISRQGERFGRLAHAMEKHGADVVSDLPVEMVMEIVYA